MSGPAADGQLPVVASDLPTGPADLRFGRTRVPVDVVATARVLPGRRTTDPVVLVSQTRFPPDVTGADRVSELWTNGERGPAIEALVEAGGRAPLTFSEADVFTSANFLGITWTFGYLSALAVFVGVIAVGGLLLYLEARSRTRVSGYVMARRLGLSRAAHLRSLAVELGSVAVAGLVLGAVLAAAAVAVVYRRLDVDLLRPPTPLLDVPVPAVLGRRRSPWSSRCWPRSTPSAPPTAPTRRPCCGKTPEGPPCPPPLAGSRRDPAGRPHLGVRASCRLCATSRPVESQIR